MPTTEQRDPYKILELTIDCSPADIRAAFRRLSQTMHPDHGGGHDAMADLVWARDLLLDPKTRDHYDRGGGVKPEEISMRDKVLQVVNGIVSSVLEGDDDEDTAPVLEKIRAWLLQARTDLGQQLRTARKKLKRARSIARRMKRRKGTGPDLFANVMRGRCELAQKRVDACKEALDVHLEVIKFFDEYDYETDSPFSYAGEPPAGVKRSDLDIRWNSEG